MSFVREAKDVYALQAELGTPRRRAHWYPAQDRDAARLRAVALADAGRDAQLPGGHYDRARRSGGRMRLGTHGRSAGRDSVAVRGGAPAGRMGHAGA